MKTEKEKKTFVKIAVALESRFQIGTKIKRGVRGRDGGQKLWTFYGYRERLNATLI